MIHLSACAESYVRVGKVAVLSLAWSCQGKMYTLLKVKGTVRADPTCTLPAIAPLHCGGMAVMRTLSCDQACSNSSVSLRGCRTGPMPVQALPYKGSVLGLPYACFVTPKMDIMEAGNPFYFISVFSCVGV